MPHIPCPICKEMFYAKPNGIKRNPDITCSKDCGIEMRMRKTPKLDCHQCGNPFYRPPNYRKARTDSAMLFCCSKCRVEYYEAQNLYTCPICGKAMVLKPKRANNESISTCSIECRTVAKGLLPSQIIACDECGKEFKRKSSDMANNNFCSNKCMGLWYSETRVGEDNHLWKGGGSNYRGDNWASQRYAARERDCYVCQGCSITETETGYTLEVHHKKPFRLYDNYEEANHLSNLVTLCRACHGKAESYARWLYDSNKSSLHHLEDNPVINRIYH